MQTMKESKGQKIELSESQGHPNLALPEDFEIGNAAINANEVVPGCYGNITPAQYQSLLRESAEARSTKPPLTGRSGLASHPKRK